MEILGIGPMELILILIVALMVFGPDRLPQIGAKLGRGMREMRKATRAISEEINSTRAAIEAPARELAEPFKDVADLAKSAGAVATAARNPGQALRDSVMRELNRPVEPAAAEDNTAEQNTIAPPLPDTSPAAEAGETTLEPSEPIVALSAPDEAPTADATPEESLAELPASDESPALPANDPSSESAEENRPPAGPDSLASTPPEQ